MEGENVVGKAICYPISELALRSAWLAEDVMSQSEFIFSSDVRRPISPPKLYASHVAGQSHCCSLSHCFERTA